MPRCEPGVAARLRAGPLAFTTGWTRLTLAPCPGAAGPAVRVEVGGADRRLAFTVGRPGGATLGVLTGSETPASGGPQRFDLPASSAAARELVLAPWPLASPPPHVGSVRLLGPSPAT